MRSEPILVKLLRWIQRRLKLEVCRVVSRPLYAQAPSHGDAEEVRFALMSEERLLPHCADTALQLSERHVRSAFARSDLCVGALHGERLIGYQWLAFWPAPHVDDIWVRFDCTARYSYKKFVRPEYRGRRIAAGLSSHADALCLQRGRTSTVAFIDWCNTASWRASARLGSRTVGYAGYLRLAGSFIPFRSPGAKRVGFQFYKAELAPGTNASPGWPRAA